MKNPRAIFFCLLIFLLTLAIGIIAFYNLKPAAVSNQASISIIPEAQPLPISTTSLISPPLSNIAYAIAIKENPIIITIPISLMIFVVLFYLKRRLAAQTLFFKRILSIFGALCKLKIIKVLLFYLSPIYGKIFKGISIFGIAHDFMRLVFKIKNITFKIFSNIIHLDRKSLSVIFLLIFLNYSFKYVSSWAINYYHTSDKIARGVTLSWYNVSVEIVPSLFSEPKRILEQASGETLPGEIIAILGPSGCGKSTLLNALSGKSSGKVYGKILANGREREYSSWCSLFGYVEQINSLNPYFTVKETLEHMASLQNPGTLVERNKQIDEIIRIMQLDSCENTTVEFISGGQKKRLSIGLELLSNSQILFLDEPTSGLDSFLTYQVVEVIYNLAREKSKTIILTIHQPRADLFHLFSKVLLITQGSAVFFGTIKEGTDFLFWNWIRNSKNLNIGDYFLDAISLDTSTPSNAQSSQYQISKLKSIWAKKQLYLFPRAASFPKLPSSRSSLSVLRQIMALTKYHYGSLRWTMLWGFIFPILYFTASSFIYNIEHQFSTGFSGIFSSFHHKISEYHPYVISSRRSNLYSPLIYIILEIFFTYLPCYMSILLAYLIAEGYNFVTSERNLIIIAMMSLYYVLLYMILSYLANETFYSLLSLLIVVLFTSIERISVLLNSFAQIPEHTNSNNPNLLSIVAVVTGFFNIVTRLISPNTFAQRAIPPDIANIHFKEEVMHITKQCCALFFILLVIFLYSTHPSLNLETHPSI